jgi:hypothetical protein
LSFPGQNLEEFWRIFFPSVNSTIFAVFEKNHQFFDITKLEGEKKNKAKQKPSMVVYKTGTLVFFFFFFFPFQKQGLNLRTAPIIQGSIPLCNNRPTLIITKVDVLITT